MIRIAAKQEHPDGRTRVVLDLDDEGLRFVDLVARSWEGRVIVRVSEHVTRTMLDVAGLNLGEEVERTLRLRLQARLAERGMTALATSGPHREDLAAARSVQFTMLALCLPMATIGEPDPRWSGLTSPGGPEPLAAGDYPRGWAAPGDGS